MKILALILLSTIAHAQVTADTAKVWTMDARRKLESQCQKDEARSIENSVLDATVEGRCSILFSTACKGLFKDTVEYHSLGERGFFLLRLDGSAYRISWCE